MKEIKIIAIAVAITIALMVVVAYASADTVNPNYGEFYPRLSVVIETHPNSIICMDKEGNLWAFFSDEGDWEIGDICNLLMWNTSEDISQHEIIEVYWEGYTENLDLFFVINGWAR